MGHRRRLRGSRPSTRATLDRYAVINPIDYLDIKAAERRAVEDKERRARARRQP